ncbi:MAG: FlgD immunoglobulin-like domain containing protein [Candidatus Eisenbacteria bacterium]
MPHRTSKLIVLLALASLAQPHAAIAGKAFVFETDYSTGSFSAVNTSTHAPSCDVASVHSDARLRWYGGRVYVVNRFGADNIQVIDPATYVTLNQFSVGNGANPYDIAFASPTKAYVTRYERTELWVVDPSTGAHTGTISLAAFADADGIPEMDHLMMVGPLLFVSLQRLDRNAGFIPTAFSLVAVIDTRTDTVVDCDAATAGVQAITLQLTNPVTAFQFDRTTSRLLLGCVGYYGALDGGIERIDPVGLASAGVAAGEDSLGGDVADLVWRDGAKSYAIVSDASFNTLLISWSPTTGRKLATVYAPGGFTLGDAEISGTELWVCDGSLASPGVRVFSTTTDTQVGGAITCSLPPASLTFDAPSGQVSGVEPQAAALALSLPAPNPVATQMRIALTLPRPARAEVSVFDPSGRRVAGLLDGEQPAGSQSLAWRLEDAQGRPVAAGLYLVRARVAGQTVTRRVLVTR